MTAEEENFAVTLADNCKTHEEWLAVMRFGLRQLLANQPLLMELIVREGQRQAKETGLAHRLASDDARTILGELGLKLTLKEG